MKAILCKDFSEANKYGRGAFWYSDYGENGEPTSLKFIAPEGETYDGDPIIAGVTLNVGQWEFDGNCDEPTITPSIFINQPTGWHGYLTKGEWIKA